MDFLKQGDLIRVIKDISYASEQYPYDQVDTDMDHMFEVCRWLNEDCIAGLCGDQCPMCPAPRELISGEFNMLVIYERDLTPVMELTF